MADGSEPALAGFLKKIGWLLDSEFSNQKIYVFFLF